MSLKKLLTKLKKKGVAKAAELASITNRMQLRRYVNDGTIVEVGYGFYAHPSLDPMIAALVVVTRYYPKAVISNKTALSVYGLTDERIDRIDVDIPNITTLKNSLLKVHRVVKSRMVGIVTYEHLGQKLRIYSKERALCDIYKDQPDGPIFLKSLKRYVKLGKVDSTTIAKYDEKLKTNVLKALTQELADG